jgi:hypothetical protein
MGVIREGDGKDGLRFAPIIVGATLLVFFVSQNIIGNFF